MCTAIDISTLNPLLRKPFTLFVRYTKYFCNKVDIRATNNKNQKC